MAHKYWLMKSEPDSYGISHLEADGVTPWSGVRNFQARNFMRDDMRVGDQVLFYHSSCPQPGVYGLATVASAAYPDPTQFDATSAYYDPRATTEKPIWHLVDVRFQKRLAQPVLLPAIRSNPALLAMRILEKGSRLSITPVTKQEFECIRALGGV